MLTCTISQRTPKFYTKYILGVYGTNSYVPILEGGKYWTCAQIAVVIGSLW